MICMYCVDISIYHIHTIIPHSKKIYYNNDAHHVRYSISLQCRNSALGCCVGKPCPRIRKDCSKDL